MRAAPRHSSFAGTPWPFWPGCSDCGIGFAATYETGAEIRSLWTGGNLSKNRSPCRRSCSHWRRRTWTLPDDVPIESKTVAKAIERAQNTVEARNAEMRKDNLKYDEVMDQQRKVIYARRLEIIDGDDLEERTEDLLAGAAEKQVAEFCPSDFQEEWDLKGLID